MLRLKRVGHLSQTVQRTNMHQTYNFNTKGLLSQQGLMYFIFSVGGALF